MPDNNAENNNYNTAKEIMKINNVDVPLRKWRTGVLDVSRIADMEPSSILNRINRDFIKRKENKVLLISIDLFLINKLKKCKNNGIMNLENYNLDKFDERILAIFNRNNNIGESFIDNIVFPKRQNGLFKIKDIKIREQIIPVLEKLIDNVNKNEIGFFDEFLKKNNLSFLKNTINSERLEQENDKIKEMFGINSRDSLTKEQREELDDKLTIIQGMKDEFNEKLSEMTPNMIEGNKNKLGDLQSNIMAEEDMVVHGAGFKHLGLFTSDVSNAISSNEMKGSKWSFNTSEIDDSKREKVLNTYKGDELVKEYKKLMIDKRTVSYEILELAPKWYNMINGGAKTEEAIVSIRSEIGGIMDDIKGMGNDDEPDGWK